VLQPRRLLPVLLAAGALWSAAPAAAAPARPCPFAQTRRALTVNTLCLINRARADHGLHRLRVDLRLVRAAREHAQDMVGRGYFSHTSPSGASSSDRIADTGWMRGRASWIVGETLGWRVGPASARWIVRAWLRSRSHRHVLLNRRYRVVGIGIVSGTPFSGAGGATYAADFGS
jgi:uncharacterized protein YkwD